MYRYALKVYGCQMNVYDGDKMKTALKERGWTETVEEEADVVILNGCSIRDKAEQKVWSDLGRFAPRWERERKPFVAVTGCVAQNVGRKMAARFPWVRFVSGPRHIGAVPDGLEKLMASPGETFQFLDDDPRAFIDLPGAPVERVNPWKAFVTIAHGCDNFCSYCIVPYVRGRFVSRPPEDILEEMRTLVADGVLEITLLGQNVNSYGSDFSDGYTFANLLRDGALKTGVRLLRFATSHPRDFTPDIVDTMAEHSPVICPSINLPIQSGSDRILALMNRGYTVERYRETVSVIRSRLPGAGLTTDLIVGHPGETEEDFRESLKVLEEFRFDLVHSAAYSPREGTAAARREDQVPREEKMARLNELNSLQSGIALEINESLVGSLFTVLLDDAAPRGDGLLQGRTPSDKVVLVEAGEEMLGRFVRVEITRADNWCLSGRIVDNGK
ncbi:tRNA-2-methylthio-N(6)-dimethylallyladenosine synthase [bioreactor metagenome]|uniref:tRNA-2-methylthio-N(6)-dimethylallyladenosine synthase n=1 Tax=bioreactor metagenome TaxID=1076179 RepID=A0A644XN17_9ZZZZ